MSVTPPKSGPSVVVVIVIGSALLVAVAAIIVALAISLTSTTKPPRDDAEDDEPETTEIVLDASWADGSALSENEVSTIQDIITGRLDELGLVADDFYVDDDQIHVTFDDDVDEAALDEAADALDVSFSAEFRPVLDSGFLCTTTQDHTDYGPDEKVTFCDDGQIAAFDLGPSEVSGLTIIGASTYLQDAGDFWALSVVFDSEGSKDLGELTQRLAGEVEGKNRLAIVLDGVVISSPAVTEEILDGQVSLTGSFTEEDAEVLAEQLRFASKGLTLSVDSSYFAD